MDMEHLVNVRMNFTAKDLLEEKRVDEDPNRRLQCNKSKNQKLPPNSYTKMLLKRFEN